MMAKTLSHFALKFPNFIFRSWILYCQFCFNFPDKTAQSSV